MAIDVYLNFNGNCREAAEFYAEVFKTEKPQIMTFGEAPQRSSLHFTRGSKRFSYAHSTKY